MEEFKEKLMQMIVPIFEGPLTERKNYYLNNSRPTVEDVEGIITSCSLVNGTMAGISGILPPPIGMLTILPELILTIENQIVMIYDIGVANGQEDHMSKEVVLALALQAGIGSVAITALASQSERILIKKASIKIFNKMANVFGLKISSSVVKSKVANCIPFLGGIAIGVWIKYTTSELGKGSALILSNNITIEETEEIDQFSQDPEETIEILENKVLVLMNLMKVDEESNEKEKEYITQIIDNIDFSYFTVAKLRIDLELSSQSAVDFDILEKSSKSDKDSLLLDMLSLAKRDGQIHAKEFDYIMSVCEKLTLDINFVITELMANFFAVKYFLKDLAIEIDEMLVYPFNNGNNKALFYKNNSILIHDGTDNLLAEGSYKIGGRKIIMKGGRVIESPDISKNLIEALS